LDSDGDGVSDADDDCLATETGIEVDSSGCEDSGLLPGFYGVFAIVSLMGAAVLSGRKRRTA